MGMGMFKPNSRAWRDTKTSKHDTTWTLPEPFRKMTIRSFSSNFQHPLPLTDGWPTQARFWLEWGSWGCSQILGKQN
jgi:hypothetical protein